MIWRVYMRQHPTLGPWYARVERRPGWVVQIALLAAVLVVLVPLFLLVAAAVLVGLAVFLVLGVLVQILRVLSGWRDRIGSRSSGTSIGDGRQNVRVIRRD